MSRTEQLQAMEMLRDSLCRNIKDLEPPAWHEKILQEREERIRQGEDTFEDWEQAKKEIRKFQLQFYQAPFYHFHIEPGNNL